MFLLLVFPNNDMTFTTFQNTLVLVQQKVLREKCCNSFLLKMTKKYTRSWCNAEGNRAITGPASPLSSQLHAAFLTLCNNQHNSLLTE